MTLSHRHHTRCACAFGSRVLAARPFTLPGTTRKYERSRPFALTHISLDLVLDVPGKGVQGTATLSFSRVDPEATELRLDAVGFTLSAVRLDEGKGAQAAKHSYDSDVLSVTIPAGVKQGKVVVEYSARPRRGLYFLAPDEHVRDRPTQVWSQCQDEDARSWFPCHDKPHLKQTTELRVRVPRGWYALSNGVLIARASDEHGEVFHWHQGKPHSSYLVTLAAGEFAVLEGGQAANVPVSYLVPRGREADGARTFVETPAMVEFFGQLTGVAFPWEKYAQVVVSDFIFGGMENTSATTMYEHILLDERAAIDIASDDLIAHELAHQWFGDYVTCRDWSHGWLNEGFATYFEHLDRERRLGQDEYDYGLKGDLDAYIGEAAGRYQRPIVCQDYEAPIDLFDRHLYEKGGLVVHMLRRDLGDDLFWKGIGRYLERHAYGLVETRDLLRALEDTSGRSLEQFFDQWVFKAGHPVLDLKIEHAAGALIIEVKQTQKTSAEVPLFALDLELDIYPESGSPRREVLRVENASETFVVPEASRPRFVVVDPRFLIVGEVSAELPADMLRHQLRQAPSGRGRWLAAAALARRDDEATVKALASTLGREDEFWGVRAEAATALGSIRTPEAMQVLLGAATTAHAKVRRVVAAALGRFQKAEAAAALQKLALKDPSYLVEAEAARALGHTRQMTAFDTLVEVLDRPSWADVIRAGAIDGLASLRDDRAVPHLTARTRYGVPTRARRAALRALPRLASDRRTRELIEEMLDDRDPHLRIDVIVALSDLGDAKVRTALNRALERETDGRVRRRLREALRDLGGSARAEQQRLHDELERLKTEFSELRGRLTRLEGGQGERASSRQGPVATKTRPAPEPREEQGTGAAVKGRRGGQATGAARGNQAARGQKTATGRARKPVEPRERKGGRR